VTFKGPFSRNRPAIEDAPGPPFSQTTKFGFSRLMFLTSQKKRL